VFSKWSSTHFKSKYLALILSHDQIFKRCTTKPMYHKVKTINSLTKKTPKILMAKFSFKKSGYLNGSNVTSVQKLLHFSKASNYTKKQNMHLSGLQNKNLLLIKFNMRKN
jgi:hypothetical protein